MNKKKILSMTLATIMCLSTCLPVFADSGSSALPQDSPMATYIYNTFAPKTQTSYKQFGATTKTKISDIRQSGEDLIIWGTDLSVGGGLVTTFAKKFSLPGKFAVGFGGLLYFTGRYVTASVKNIQDDALCVQEVYFMWTDPEQFEYKVMIKTWIEYGGRRISDVSTDYRTGDLY